MMRRNVSPDTTRPPVSRSAAAANVIDPSESPTARLYRVQAGDDLRSIAERAYGCAEFWVFILQANPEEIRDGMVLHPGQILHLPDLNERVGSHRGRASAEPE